MREGLHKIVPVDDSIVAISTPFGRSGIGVVRVSGAQVRAVAARYFAGGGPLHHRCAVVGRWQDGEGRLVDQVIATFFESPYSYTGEDVLEISAHGNPLVLDRIVETVRAAGVRAAAPGEFTLRAVAGGKMDLLQAEAVRDFIAAQSDIQARTALRQMEGALSSRIVPLKDELINLIAHLEAGIDFADDDVELAEGSAIASRAATLRRELEMLQETYAYGRILNAGIQLAIVGRPNVGKSSLFNRLVASDRAIVTENPGTTRDVLRETVSFDGIPLRFLDTAGLRDAVDPVEKIGVARTLEALIDADLVLLVLDGTEPLDDADRAVLEQGTRRAHIIVINKSDQPQRMEFDGGSSVVVCLSAKTGEGMDGLHEAIRRFLGRESEALSDSVLTSARQNELVLRAVAALRTGESAAASATPHEMVLLDFYEALSALNELTGEVVTEDILGRIFSSFCIGK